MLATKPNGAQQNNSFHMVRLTVFARDRLRSFSLSLYTQYLACSQPANQPLLGAVVGTSQLKYYKSTLHLNKLASSRNVNCWVGLCDYGKNHNHDYLGQ